MADAKGSMGRLISLVLILVFAGGGYLYMRSRPPKGGNLQAIVLEDSAEIISGGKTLEDVKVILKHPNPVDAGEGVFVFDISQVDPQSKDKVEAIVRGGKVIGLRFQDDRIPPPKASKPGPGDPEPEAEPAPETPPADGGTGAEGGGG
ncbi:MAG: hypothetical protein IT435_11665 [Phycisphaerales bacterium]|nr:hypothetical protein [Phycisphaerales bacterium]